MTRQYRCPHCDANLNPAETIVLLGSPEGGDKLWLVGLHPDPGNYEVHAPAEVPLKKGDRWDFSCPLCRARLVSAHNADLCEVLLDGDPPKKIVFSRIAGEQVTFVIDDVRRIAERHGSHADHYVHHLIQMKYIL